MKHKILKIPFKNALSKDYHRGFFFSDSKDNSIFEGWVSEKIGGFALQYDPKNQFYLRGDANSFVAILGHAVDAIGDIDTLRQISDQLFGKLNTPGDAFFDYLDQLNGRFVVFYKEHGFCNVKVLNDACGTRSVFYAKNSGVHLASHPNLLASQIKAVKNNNHQLLSKYTSYHLPGNVTTWCGIYQLIPNHYYDSETNKLVRFFPRKALSECECVTQQKKYLTDYMRKDVARLNKFSNILCSITAGIDSRITLSATKQICENIDFFTYSGGMGECKNILSTDKKVVAEIVDNLNLKHQFINFDNTPNREIELFKNKSLSESHITHNAAVAVEYISRFSGNNYMHLRSNLLEIGRRFYRDNGHGFNSRTFSIDSAVTCYSPKAIDDSTVIEMFSTFFSEINYSDLPEGYDPFDLFYWEYRMGIWHSMVLLESDAAFDTHIIFNSRIFFMSLLSIPDRYRRDNRFFLSLCEDSWPILNYWGINDKRNLSNLFDREIHSSPSSISFDKSIVSSGSSEENRFPSFNSIIKSNSALYNLSDSNPRKGDYITLKTILPKKQIRGRNIIINYRHPFGGNTQFPQRLESQIIVNGAKHYSQDVSKWKEINSIVVIPDTKSEDVIIEIKVIALTNCESWSWGKASTIVIERINLI